MNKKHVKNKRKEIAGERKHKMDKKKIMAQWPIHIFKRKEIR